MERDQQGKGKEGAGSHHGEDPGSRLFEVIITRPIVDDQSGEVQVSFTNLYGRPLLDVDLTMGAAQGARAGDGSLFVFLPSAENGGYAVGAMDPGKSESRTFCVRPVEAEVGKSYVVEVVASYCLPAEESQAQQSSMASRSDEKRKKASERGHEQYCFELPVEARPEVYLAIGAAEELREALQRKIEEWTEIGRTTHDARKRKSALPSLLSAEPARMALSESTFDTVLGMVELGSRFFASQVKKNKPAAGDKPVAPAKTEPAGRGAGGPSRPGTGGR